MLHIDVEKLHVREGPGRAIHVFLLQNSHLEVTSSLDHLVRGEASSVPSLCISLFTKFGETVILFLSSQFPQLTQHTYMFTHATLLVPPLGNGTVSASIPLGITPLYIYIYYYYAFMTSIHVHAQVTRILRNLLIKSTHTFLPA